MSAQARDLRSAPMSHLEERYRAVLRWLPADYRNVWEADMVAAFLASKLENTPESTAENAGTTRPGEEQDGDDWDSDEFVSDFGGPGLGEIGSVAALAVRLRVTGGAGTARARALNRAVRLAVLMVMLYHGACAIASLLAGLWLVGHHQTTAFEINGNTNLWYTAWNMAGYAWLPAYLALVFGYRRIAQAVALLALVPFAVTVGIEQVTRSGWFHRTDWTLVLLDVLVVVGMSAFGKEHCEVPRRRWLLALAIGTLVYPLSLWAVLTALTESQTVELAELLDIAGIFCGLVTVTALGYLAACAFGRHAPALPWSAAIALLAGGTLLIRLVTLPEPMPWTIAHMSIRVALAEIAVTLLVGAPLAISAIRQLRDLPTHHGGPPGGAWADGELSRRPDSG